MDLLLLAATVCSHRRGSSKPRALSIHFEIREYSRIQSEHARGGSSFKCFNSCCCRFELYELLMDVLLLAATPAATVGVAAGVRI